MAKQLTPSTKRRAFLQNTNSARSSSPSRLNLLIEAHLGSLNLAKEEKFQRSELQRTTSGPKMPNNKESIGEDFFERFQGLLARTTDYRLRAEKESSEKGQNGNNGSGGNVVPVPTGRRDSRSAITGDELEELYVEVLYTIKHKIGQAEQFQYMCDNEELLEYVQTAFGIDNVRHQRLLSKANQEKPPKVLLNITVIEARDVEAKDPNGFSDPYCMLGLIGHKSRRQVETMTSSPIEKDSPEEKDSWRKRSSLYRSSRTKSRRDNNAEILEQLPAKFIRTTTVKNATLNPVWNESFQLVVDNVNEDVLHLDVFDYDAEYEVMDALRNVKNVQGIKGLNRYFKQIAQSARKSADENVDDFLGCVDIKVLDVPSMPIDKVFPLYTRTVNKQKLQGTIRLRMNLSTREDHNHTLGNNLTDFIQHRELMMLFMKKEIKACKNPLEWNGELSDLAEAILHQHAVQGDINDLQQAACTFIAMMDVHTIFYRLDYLVLFQALKHLDSLWVANGLSLEADELTAEAVGLFKDTAFESLSKQRDYFPMNSTVGLKQLESMLKCLRLLYNCKLFKRFFPLDDNLEEAINNAITAAATDYYNKKRLICLTSIRDEHVPPMELLSDTIIAINYDLRKYFRLAEKVYSVFKIRYFALTFAELDRLVNEDLDGLVVFKNGPECGSLLDNRDPYAMIKDDFFTAPGKEEPSREIFVLYLAANDFVHFRKDLTDEESGTLCCTRFHRKFVPFVLQWFSYAKLAAKRKMKYWVENDKVSRAESIVRYSTSVTETDNCLSIITKFLIDLKWPVAEENLMFICKLTSDLAEEMGYFSELTYRAFKDCGWCEHELLEVNDDLCIAVNNLEMIRVHCIDLMLQLDHTETVKKLKETNDPVIVKFANDCECVINQSLTTGQKMLTDRITNALEKMVKKIVRHLSKLPTDPNTPAEMLIDPLLHFIGATLSNLHPLMLKANFLRFLEVLWMHILDQMLVVTLNNKTKDPICFANLYQSFQIFIDFFGGEKGLPREVLESDHYQSVRRKVFYHQLSTTDLIDSFLTEAAHAQTTAMKSPYGSITVRAHFDRKNSKLLLEIIHARDVIPMDSNGLSDPFVVIRFLPTRLFGGMQTAKTRVVKKCLDPDFDERFEFNVPLDKCAKDCAVLQLALMDHDLMFQDELAGLAFLQLSTIPGLKGEQTKNFAGLREITLPMLHPKSMTKGILADIVEVIKCRDNQKEAQEFLSHLYIQ